MNISQNTLNVIIAFSSIATAIGTIGACIIALHFARNDKKPKFKITCGLYYECINRGTHQRIMIPIGADAGIDLDNFCSEHNVRFGISATNMSTYSQFISSFYLEFKSLFGYKRGVLFFNNQLFENGENISNPILPCQTFSMYSDPKILTSTTVLSRFLKEKPKHKRVKICLETTTGQHFRSTIERSLFDFIQDKAREAESSSQSPL